MKKTILREGRGSTLVELMVAIVILAIVVMFIALIPTQSQQLMLRADRVSAASAAARDKMEYFRSVLGRTSPTYGGFDSLSTWYANGTWYPDTFKFSEIKVLRRWQFTWSRWPSNPPGPNNIGSVILRCIPMENGAWTADTVVINSLVAKRDDSSMF